MKKEIPDEREKKTLFHENLQWRLYACLQTFVYKKRKLSILINTY